MVLDSVVSIIIQNETIVVPVLFCFGILFTIGIDLVWLE